MNKGCEGPAGVFVGFISGVGDDVLKAVRRCLFCGLKAVL